MGSLLFEEEDYAGAFQHFDRVTTKFSDAEFAAEAMYRGAECLVRMNQGEQAATMFEKFAATYPDNPLAVDASLRAGDGHFVAGEFDRAVEIYSKILKDQPPPPIKEQALYRVALARHNGGDSADSASSFRILLQEFPESEYSVEAHLRIGDYVLRDRGEAVEAMEHFKTAYEAEPDGPLAGRALKGLALARLESKDFEGAAATLSQLIGAYEDVTLNAETYAWLGQHRFDQEEWSDAARAFDRLLELSPDYPNAPLIAFKSAEAHERNGDSDKALQGYDAAVKIAGASGIAVEAQYRMAKIHEEASRMDMALAFYEAAANSNSGDAAAQARFRLGVIYEGKEEYAAAARHFMRVAILFLHEELSPESLWRAGLCFEKSGDTNQAISTYREVVKDFPDTEQAAKAKIRVKELGGP